MVSNKNISITVATQFKIYSLVSKVKFQVNFQHNFKLSVVFTILINFSYETVIETYIKKRYLIKLDI